MLLKLPFLVVARGELVVLTVGGTSWSLEFQDALGLSAMLRREAKFAKVSSGDGSHRWGVIGVLRDANAPAWRQARWRKLPERLKLKGISVKSSGALVTTTIGRLGMTMPYDAAFEIAQALRVHGKAARNAANEAAHWSKLAGAN